jgi:hypothetical protein
MIWSLVCSVYIIYLYRKLNAAAPVAAQSGDDEAQAAIATLNAKLDRLEALAASDRPMETKP